MRCGACVPRASCELLLLLHTADVLPAISPTLSRAHVLDMMGVLSSSGSSSSSSNAICFEAPRLRRYGSIRDRMGVVLTLTGMGWRDCGLCECAQA